MALNYLQKKVNGRQKGKCREIKAQWNIVFLDPGSGCLVPIERINFPLNLENGLLKFPVSEIPEKAVAFEWHVVIEVTVKIFGEQYVLKREFRTVRTFFEDRVTIRTFEDEECLGKAGHDNSELLDRMLRNERTRIVRSKFDKHESIDWLICEKDSLLLDLKSGQITEIEKSK